jgi:hypothetical protein
MRGWIKPLAPERVKQSAGGIRSHRGGRTKRGLDPLWMGLLEMLALIHWFLVNENVLAILVTAGVAVLLICCLECSDCSHREKDDLFRRHGL